MTTFSALIVGAGPFGLSLAAYLGHRHINYLMVGKPASFWKRCIGPGALQDLAHDWHLDPLGVDTLAAYRQANPLPLDVNEPAAPISFEQYARWFQERKMLQILPWCVERIAPENGGYVATMHNGEQIAATSVVLATCLRTCSLGGCRVNTVQRTLLGSQDILARLNFRNGYLQLDHQFQTSLPGLFVASMRADQEIKRPAALFAQARASATSIGQAIHQRMQTG